MKRIKRSVRECKGMCEIVCGEVTEWRKLERVGIERRRRMRER